MATVGSDRQTRTHAAPSAQAQSELLQELRTSITNNVTHQQQQQNSSQHQHQQLQQQEQSPPNPRVTRPVRERHRGGQSITHREYFSEMRCENEADFDEDMDPIYCGLVTEDEAEQLYEWYAYFLLWTVVPGDAH